MVRVRAQPGWHAEGEAVMYELALKDSQVGSYGRPEERRGGGGKLSPVAINKRGAGVIEEEKRGAASQV